MNVIIVFSSKSEIFKPQIKIASSDDFIKNQVQPFVTKKLLLMRNTLFYSNLENPTAMVKGIRFRIKLFYGLKRTQC